jgi:hypothetical protein
VATDTEVSTALKQLLDYYAPKDMTKERLNVYRQQLAALDGGVLADAVAKCLTSNTWFPKLNELFAIVKDIEEYPELDDGKVYWRAMGTLSAYFRGKIAEEDLDKSKSWLRFKHHHTFETYNPAHDTDNWNYTPEELVEMAANNVSGDAIEKNTHIGIKP